MGDVISTHLDESKREMITARTGEVLGEFGRLYEQQYAVALFNGVRFEIEGSGGPQPQLLHRKVPLEDSSIFSGTLHLYLEENKKWRSRYLFVPDSYVVACYENQLACERGLHPKGTLNCAGYRVLTSMDQYLELVNSTLPAVKAKAGSSPFLKCTTQFPLLLWHPYSRHHYFCASTEKEQQKWLAVFQDCIRHSNNGLSEESKVQTPAFTDAVRLLRQAHGLYGTWEMMCGAPPQILANLVMETLLPELRNLIAASLKGKLHERQRNWVLISDAVYTQVQSQTQARYEAVLLGCEGRRPQLEASIRTDMDQMITSKEHVASKIRAVVLPKAEQLLKDSVQPYISSILEALMEPTSRGFAEVRDVLFRELVDMSKNVLNDGGKEKLGEHMEKISMLAFHPVKMQSCYEKVELLHLEGLQQRFDVSSLSVFVQRAQILMREQMDNAVYTFEQLLHQSLESQGGEDLCKIIQCAQDRVLKKYDYDSSTVRKKFFREALLQIFIPYMLKQLSPSCSSELSNFQELIFEDFSRFILVESIFEEVVLQSIMKDIMLAVKEAAVQRRHNLYRDSIVLTNSDPSLQLLGENLPIDWAGEYGSGEAELKNENHVDGDKPQKKRRVKQVVSMIQLDGVAPVSNESCLDVPGVDGIPEEVEGEGHQSPDNDTPAITNGTILQKEGEATAASTVHEVRVEKPGESPPQEAESRKMMESAPQEAESRKTMESPPQEAESRKTMESAPQEAESRKSTESPPQEAESRQRMEIPLQETEIKETTDGFIQDADSRSDIERAIQEIDSAVQGEEIDQLTESTESEVTKPTPPSQQVEQPTPKESSSDKPPEMVQPTMDSTPHLHDNSSLQFLTNGTAEQAKGEPIAETSKAEDAVGQPQTAVMALEQGKAAPHSDSATGEEGS